MVIILGRFFPKEAMITGIAVIIALNKLIAPLRSSGIALITASKIELIICGKALTNIGIITGIASIIALKNVIAASSNAGILSVIA